MLEQMPSYANVHAWIASLACDLKVGWSLGSGLWLNPGFTDSTCQSQYWLQGLRPCLPITLRGTPLMDVYLWLIQSAPINTIRSMLAALMAGVRLREKMVFLGEIMAANKGVVIQIPGSNSMASHSLAHNEMHCILGISTPMLDNKKSLSMGIARYTRNLDFSLDTGMFSRAKPIYSYPRIEWRRRKMTSTVMPRLMPAETWTSKPDGCHPPN